MKRVILLFSILLFSTYTILAQSLSTETFSEANENLPLIGDNFDVPIDVDGFGELLTLTIYLDYDQVEVVEELAYKWDKSISKTISTMLNDMIEIMKTSGIDDYGNQPNT